MNAPFQFYFTPPPSFRVVVLALTLMGSATLAQAQTTAAAPAFAVSTPTASLSAEQTPELKAEVMDLKALKYEDMGPMHAGHGSVRSKTLVATPDGTVSVQIGEAPRHTHQKSVEIQYVISGSGIFWLDDKPRHVHPGDLIIVPKNTVHAGSHANSGHFKTISIKLPPPVDGDSQWVK